MKYAIIGVGNMGTNHARVIHEMEDVQLVAVSDTNQDIAETVAKLCGCGVFSDYNQMLAHCDIDAVSICVPTSLHAKVAMDCMQQVKHVLLEKPIAMTVEEGNALQAYALEQNVQLMVGHTERFNPAVVKVKELLDKNEIGRVVSVIARRVGTMPPQIRDANIAIDLAIHDLDIVNYLLNALPVEVMSDKRRNHIKLREDSVEFFLRYADASAFIQANWITPVKIRKLSITGTDGYLEMDYISQQIQLFKSNYEKSRTPPEKPEDYVDYILKYLEPDVMEIAVARREPLKEEILHFINLIKAGKPADCQHAIHALEIALQA